MKRIVIILIGLISVAYGQSSPTSAKTRFVNGLYLGTKLDSYFAAADSNAIYWRADSVVMAKYKGTARALAFKSSVDSLKDNYIHLKDYGGDSTGTTNSDAAFNAAISAAIAKDVSLFIDDGDWLVTSISISNFNRSIIGFNAKIITTTAEPAFNITNSDSIAISGLRFKGNKTTGQIGIRLSKSKAFSLNSIIVDSTDYGLYIDSTIENNNEYDYNGQINNVFIGNTKMTGIYLGKRAQYLQINSPTVFNGDSIGIVIDGGNNVISNPVVLNHEVNVEINGYATSNSDHGSIIGGAINHGRRANIVLNNVRFSFAITGTQIYASGTDSYKNYGNNFGVFIKGGSGVSLIGNNIARNGVNIGFDSTDYNIFSGNILRADPGATDAHIKEYGSTNSLNNFFPSNTFIDDGITIDSILLLSGSRYGGTVYASKVNAGGTILSNSGGYGEDRLTITTPNNGFDLNLQTIRFTASRGWTFQNKSGVVADSSDVALKLNISDTATMLEGLSFDRVLNNGSSSGRSFTSGSNSVIGGGGSSTLMIGSNTITAADANLRLRTGSAKYNWQLAAQNNADNIFEITPSDAVGGSAFNTPALTLTRLGSLTTNSFIKSGGTSTQALIADGSVQTLTSGTYTPTLTNTQNISSSTASVSSYTRIGNIVTVYTTASATTSAAGQAELTFSLPIATSSANATITGSGIDSIRFPVTSGSSGTTVGARWTATSGTATTIYVTFQYTVN